jgi:D-alanyl-lipoteichoic acid acyltransferase DltB (MBOAT superfamily)
LGISFFTFHGISYVVDVARSETLAERNLRDYALYLFVFPHQIAGPIVRYAEIREEIKRPRTAPLDETTLGLARFSWGLTKKVVVADPCGRLADELFAISAAGGDLSAADAWLAAALFTVQIYFDFSGYSDMAVGMAMMMRFHFPENFRQPYRSISVTDFWRRWHITLSRWFRDYVYIPLGGNRHGALRATAALLTVFLLTSLWHGAAWTFLVWGGMHSAFLVIERVTGLRRTSRFAVLRRLAMLIFLVVSWVPFRATSLRALENHWGAMFGGPWTGLGPTALTGITPFVALALVIAIISLFGPRDRSKCHRTGRHPMAPSGGRHRATARGVAVDGHVVRLQSLPLLPVLTRDDRRNHAEIGEIRTPARGRRGGRPRRDLGRAPGAAGREPRSATAVSGNVGHGRRRVALPLRRHRSHRSTPSEGQRRASHRRPGRRFRIKPAIHRLAW